MSRFFARKAAGRTSFRQRRSNACGTAISSIWRSSFDTSRILEHRGSTLDRARDCRESSSLASSRAPSHWSSRGVFAPNFSTSARIARFASDGRCEKSERVEGTYDVITARAVASLAQLLKISAHLSTRNTVWALPKGRSAERELAEALQAWQGNFRVEPSATDVESFIVVGTEVRARK